MIMSCHFVIGTQFFAKTSIVTAPQDAHGGLVLQVYLGSNTLEFSV